MYVYIYVYVYVWCICMVYMYVLYVTMSPPMHARKSDKAKVSAAERWRAKNEWMNEWMNTSIPSRELYV